MSTTMTGILTDANSDGHDGVAGGRRSEPPRGRAQLPAGADPGAGTAREMVDLVLSDELVDQLLAGAKTPGEINGPDGLLKQLTRRFVERAMETELTDHLGYEPHQEPAGGAGNTRNGSTPKK